MKYKYVIFDLDGTLLDTLNDLLYALNVTSETMGFEKRFSYEEARSFIGNGIKVFAYKASMVLGIQGAVFYKFLTSYSENYYKYQGLTTKPFNGVKKTLYLLNKENVKLFIATNKPQKMTDAIVNKCLPNLFVDMVGQSDDHKIKPDPEIIEYLCQKYLLTKKDILYVGDSLVDKEFAKNAGLDFCLCLYGYGDYSDELLKGNKYNIKNFVDLKSIIL